MNKPINVVTFYGTLSKAPVRIKTDVLPIKGDNVWINDEHYVVKNRNIFYLEDCTEIDIIVELYEY